MNKAVHFSGMICYLNDLLLNIDDFKNNILDSSYSEETFEGKGVKIFNLEYTDNFLKINFSDGSSMPRNPKVYDTTTHDLTDNPRKKNQIEPKEHFAIIDFNTSFLWLNNTKKKTLLKDFLQKFFKNKPLLFKDIYNEEKFKKSIKTLNGIKVSAIPANMFAQTNTLSKSLDDELFLAKKAELKLSYENVKVLGKIKDKILSIFNHKESFHSITISGRDEKGLGMYFNNNLFTRKISFNSEVDENGMFSPQIIFSELISEIKKEKV